FGADDHRVTVATRRARFAGSARPRADGPVAKEPGRASVECADAARAFRANGQAGVAAEVAVGDAHLAQSVHARPGAGRDLAGAARAGEARFAPGVVAAAPAD